MSDSTELRTVSKCTHQLETALKSPSRELIHSLKDNGFISDGQRDEILDTQSSQSEAEKAGELVEWIKNRVALDCGSFHSLLQCLEQHGTPYQSIVDTLKAEHSEQLRTLNAGSNSSFQSSAEGFEGEKSSTSQLHYDIILSVHIATL